MESLPIDSVLDTITAHLRGGRDVVLEAPPGSGKTTRVPPALIDAGFSGVVVLEPRRIAARLAARRVAQERGEVLGETIGYQVRFERVASAKTRLMFLTEGLLTRRLLGDVELRGVDVVIFDEFHERSLNADVGLGFVREIQATIRPDLRIVVMSATLDAEGLAKELGAVVVRTDGRAHPVVVEHLDRPDDSPAPLLVGKAVRRVIDAAGGRLPCDTLVFLPGVGEIARTQNELRDVANEVGFDILPLHGDQPVEDQERAVRRGARPRLVLATNVAETSLTLDGIALVIDSGLARVLRSSPKTGVERLQLEHVSRANLTQRAGRAGRQSPGRAIRLFTKIEESRLDEALEPEVTRVDLASTLLALLAFGVRDPSAFAWVTKPPLPAIEAGLELLRLLGAVSIQGTLTPLGARLAKLPVAPRIARLLVEAIDRGVSEDGAVLAALAGNSTIVARAHRDKPVVSRSDLLQLRDRFFEARAANFHFGTCASIGIDARAARAVDREARELERSVRGRDRSNGADEDDLLRCVLAGFPDRVARRRSKGGGDAIAANGLTFEIDASSGVRDAELFVAVDAVELQGRKVKASLLSEVREEWLEELHPSLLRDEIETRFDEAKGRVEARRRRFFLGLPLRELAACDPDPVVAAKLLAEAATHPRYLESLRARGLDEWLARIDCVRQAKPELGLLEPDGALIRSALERSLIGLSRLDAIEIEQVARGIVDAITPPGYSGPSLYGLLERLVPRRLTLPSGRSAEIEYVRGRPPRIAARLQEFFGQKSSPRICDGRTVIAIDLLTPGGKSVQITSDLSSFWSNLYPRERRELMRKYPRHSWPEDPTTAQPTARPTPRR